MTKLVTVKLLLALDVSKNWRFVKLDVNNIFFSGNFFEEVYMDLPPRYQPHCEIQLSTSTRD